MVQIRQFYLPGCDLGIALRSVGNNREDETVGAMRVFDPLVVDRILGRKLDFESLLNDARGTLAKAFCVDGQGRPPARRDALLRRE